MDALRQQLIDATDDPQYVEAALAAIPDDVTTLTGTLEALYLYVLKGARPLTVQGRPLPFVEIAEHGLTTPGGAFSDREMTLVLRKNGQSGGQDYDHLALQQALAPPMSLIKVDTPRENLLTLSAEGYSGEVEVARHELHPHDGEKARVGVKTEGAFDGVLLSDKLPIVQWVRDFLALRKPNYDVNKVGIAVRPRDFRREITGAIGDDLGLTTSYSDGAQISVATQADRDWLNQNNPGRDIDMEAFRMNLVLGGLPPHALALIKELQMAGGAANILITTLCVRCAATRVLQNEGARGDKQHLDWLGKYAPHRPNKLKSAPSFGSNAVSRSIGARLKVGESFAVTMAKGPYENAEAFPRTDS